MVLMFVADWISGNDTARQSLMLWILLAAAVGLAAWECRERGYRLTVLLWWSSFVALTHVIGYLILRYGVRRPEGMDQS